jgi:hypothetical protein
MDLFHQALKYRSVTDIVQPIREIVMSDVGRKLPDILSDQSETEVYCLSDLSVFRRSKIAKTIQILML